MTILDQIVEYKRTEEIPQRMQALPLDTLQMEASTAPPARDFIGALRSRPSVALIAEVKRASPSKGVLRSSFDPLQVATTYAANGASAISILTDEPFFQGSLSSLKEIRRRLDSISLEENRSGGPWPLLRKDFIVHEYQIYEARAAGADALLLIAAILSDESLAALLALTQGLGMAALVEVHSAEELKRALRLGPRIVGVNNRNLHDFHVDLGTCLSLRSAVPGDICFVAESGIRSRADVERLGAAGVDAVLVGEALITAPDVGAKVRELVRGR
jgi:indole-3-glycerol phosphate synthase